MKIYGLPHSGYHETRQDVAKLSDVEGKGMCKNEDYIKYLRRTIKWRMENEN